jgi:hypothetical protein
LRNDDELKKNILARFVSHPLLSFFGICPIQSG